MATTEQRKILDKIDEKRDHVIEFLQKIISIPSVTGNEGPIQDFLGDYLGNLGLDVDKWETDWEELKKHPGYRPVAVGYEGRPNIVATLNGTGGGRSLLLNGHVDVIPIGMKEGWSQEPWGGKIEDGRIYGRGAADMKSGVATHIMVVECMLAAGLKPKGDIMINLVIDEELSGHGTLDTVIRGYKADGGISGETSGLAVQPACIGRIWFEIMIRGKVAGIQTRYEGVSGIELGTKICKAVQDLEDTRVATVSHPLYPNALDSLPCIIGSFSAGNYPSACPDTCLLKGSIGTVPGEDHQGVKDSLVAQIARAAAE
ncbi:MAG: M20/M25/M40 family metallo-hydrolase, partial [Rhodospirillales bacterium]|nr:M20/M25/M40 family metallo-hydrolase [Rhodospirillales bacterium]